MTQENEKKMDDHIVMVSCSPNLKLYAVITQSGRLMVYRNPHDMVWSEGGGNEKYYTICWHPESKYITCCYAKNGNDHFSLIFTESFTFLLELPIFYVCKCQWYTFQPSIMRPDENDLKNRFNLQDTVNIQQKNDENLTDLQNTLNFVCFMGINDFIIYLQGIVKLFSISYTFIDFYIDSNLTLILLTNDNRICCSKDIKKIESSVDLRVLANTLHVLQQQIKFIESELKRLPYDSNNRIIHFFQIFKPDHLELLKLSFIRCFYFGQISSEISCLLSNQSVRETITGAPGNAANLNEIFPKVYKIQCLLEKILAILVTLKSLQSAHMDLANSQEYLTLSNEFTTLHSWVYTFIKLHHESNLINGVRIFTAWVEHIREIVSRRKKNISIPSTDPFGEFHDLGSEPSIKLILLRFLFNDFERLVNDPLTVLNILPFSCATINEALFYFLRYHFHYFAKDIDLSVSTPYYTTRLYSSIAATSSVCPYTYFAIDDSAHERLRIMRLENSDFSHALKCSLAFTYPTKCIQLQFVEKNLLMCLSKPMESNMHKVQLIQVFLDHHGNVRRCGEYEFELDSNVNIRGASVSLANWSLLIWTDNKSIITIDLNKC